MSLVVRRSLASIGRRILPLLLVGAALLPVACGPINGETGAFVQQPTTNTDFLAEQTVPLGNLPTTMDITTSGGVLDLVAAVNNISDTPLNPDGSFNYSGTVTILQNTAGTFSTLATLTTQQFPTVAKWADFAGNGSSLDLVMLDNLNKHLAVYCGTPGTPPTWSNTPSYEVSFSHSVQQMSIADLNADGKPDVVLTVPADDIIYSLLNAGTGCGASMFSEPTTTAQAGLTMFIAADLDGDGKPDLALLNGSTTLMELWKGAGDGTFTQTFTTNTISLTSRPISIVSGKFTGSASTDLAVLSDTGNTDTSDIRIYANNGTGTLSASNTIHAYQRPKNLYVLNDVTGAGSIDLGVTHTNQRFLSILKHNGGNSYTLSQPETTRNPTAIEAGDIDGDGIADLVTTESTRRVIGVFRSDGSGGLTRTQIGLLTEPTFPRLVDVNGDAKLDLIVLEPNSDKLGVFLNAH
ncbi:MAG TPA: VCBS repeat-containing protein [bacterium]|nr:VCBS repeat-containing protein [bacterium]